MNNDTIEHPVLKQLADAGTIQQATAVALGENWSLMFKIGKAEKVLSTINGGQPRVWRHLDSLVRYLSSIGIVHFGVDAGHYAPDDARKRPDKAAVLKQAHEAAAHDKWFRQEVKKAIAEADTNPDSGIPWEEVRGEMESWIKDLESH